VDVNAALDSVGLASYATLSGYVELQYKFPWHPICAFIRNVDTVHSMIFLQSAGYQEETHARLDAALARGELFAGFLTTFPRFTINHSILVYKRKSFSPNPGIEHYLVYDPNHPESPRELTWSPHTRSFSYQKDWDFVGGYVRVYQVYGKWLQ